MRNLLLRSRRWLSDGLIVLVVAAALFLAVWGIRAWLENIGGLGDAVGIVQVFATALVVVAGGIFAYRKLQLFRDFEPHLTVTQRVSSRAVGEQYAHIAVTATLHNGSKVRVEVRECVFQAHQIQPLSDDDVEHYYVEAFREAGSAYIEWPLIDDVTRRLESNEIVIEPGAYHHEPCEFIVSRDATTLLVYSYFFNTGYCEAGTSAQGWSATTVHDIVLNDGDHDILER